MIAKGKAVSHEGALVEYALGKKDAEYISSHNLLSSPVLMVSPSAQEILDEFRQHRQRFPRHNGGRRMDSTILRFELCPTAKETRGWTHQDWNILIHDFIEILDDIDYVRIKSGGRHVPMTNVANTQWVAFLHHDGADECDHIHLLANRIDADGQTIPDAYLLAKCEMAANILNNRHGWKQSMDIAREHRKELREMCYDILRKMDSFNWDRYFRRITERGYRCSRRFDENGNQRGYSIYYGNTSIAASDIDRGLTWGKIYDTWEREHTEAWNQLVEDAIKDLDELYSPPHKEDVPSSKEKPDQNGNDKKPELPRYKVPFMDSDYKITGDIEATSTETFERILHDEIELADQEDYYDEEGIVFPTFAQVTNVTVSLFLNYLDNATRLSESYGGGGGDLSGWGQKKDEDEEEWARRCAQMASYLCKPDHHPKISRSRSRMHR